MAGAGLSPAASVSAPLTEPLTEPGDAPVLILDDREPLPGGDHAQAPQAALTGQTRAPSAPIWRILVVDDDPDVHESTRYALGNIEVAGRPLSLLHAHSGAEGLAVLRREKDIAVVLLDVVMESEDAGLLLVERIRGELALSHLRIILRTGQPGQAPELETIRRYDINDYKTKSELTRSRLYATLTAALRSYDQLSRLDASRQGLEKVIVASNAFTAERGLVAFAEGVIMQIAGLIGIEAEGLVCAFSEPGPQSRGVEELLVVAAAGSYRHHVRRPLCEIGAPRIADRLVDCLNQRASRLDTDEMLLFFPGQDGRDSVAYVSTPSSLDAVARHLLQVFCTNITLYAANVSLVERLQQSAFVDRQLALPNRTALLDHLDRLITTQSLSGQVLAVLDIDQFAETNDMFGHQAGDALLGTFARRLTQALSARCTVARVGGDTFAVVGSEADVDAAALRELMSPPFELEGASRRLSVSISLLRCDESQAENGSDLLKDAYIALKRAKTLGPGHTENYTRLLGAESRRRTALLHALQRGIEQQQLFMVYQPKVDLASRQVVGLEALMRWRSDDGSLVPPDSFIPVAEQSGLIVELGRWSLQVALRDLQTLQASGHPRLQMAVNVSPMQFVQSDFLATVDEVLAQHAVEPALLELEITEGVAMLGDMSHVVAVLRALRTRGVGIAIDDFGTGYSSLSYLDQLPAQRLKIDRAFVNLLDTDRPGARIARMIVPLGHQLGMKVLAEGVETPQQARTLLEMGCDEAQGYLYARPMDLGSLLSWLPSGALGL